MDANAQTSIEQNGNGTESADYECSMKPRLLLAYTTHIQCICSSTSIFGFDIIMWLQHPVLVPLLCPGFAQFLPFQAEKRSVKGSIANIPTSIALHYM